MEWILLLILVILWYYGHSIYSELEYFKEQQGKALEARSENTKALLDTLRLIKDETAGMAHELREVWSILHILERAISEKLGRL